MNVADAAVSGRSSKPLADSPRPVPGARNVEQAAGAAKPKLRYTAGGLAGHLRLLLTYALVGLIDAGFRKDLRLDAAAASPIRVNAKATEIRQGSPSVDASSGGLHCRAARGSGRGGRYSSREASTMHEVWLSAPALALHAWPEDAGGPGFRANGALLRWALRRGVTDGQWSILAALVRAAPGGGSEVELEFCGVRLRCIAVPAPSGGTLGWLEPLGADAPGPVRTEPWLAGMLDLLQEFGHLAPFERNLRTGVGRWSPALFEMFGLPLQELPPPTEALFKALHPEDRDRAIADWKRSIHRNGREEFRFRLIRGDGQVRHIHAITEVRPGADGLPELLVGAMIDDTHTVERVRQHEAIAARAEQSNRAKSEFIARMSHELRTPLNAVLGFAQLLMRDPDQPLAARQAARARHIQSAGRQLMALMDDALDLASIEAGTLRVELQPTALQAALDDVLPWMQPAAEREGVSLHARRLPGWVRADPRRLRQVLTNLLSNAMKYNHRGGEVRVEGELVRLADGDAWHVHVCDTGRGMTPAQLAHLFEPFNRLGAETGPIEGLGLGLTIVRHLVGLMGGAIHVKSEPGRGSEFSVSFPAAQPPVFADSRPAGTHMAPGTALELLYVEDNPVNVLLVEQVLAARPLIRLHSAPDGRSGIALAHRIPLDGVLVDMHLPDIDGFEVLKRLRSDPGTACLRCVALSASAMQEDIQQAMSAGFAAYWTKPIDVAALVGAIERMFIGAPRSSVGAAAPAAVQAAFGRRAGSRRESRRGRGASGT